jgi:uncharacterized protein YbjT (DUF2867 family)
MSGKILVLGATGNVGRPLVDALVAKGEAVKAASRGGAPVGGAEGVRFDYSDPSTFATALDGVDRVFVMLAAGYTDPVAMLSPIVEAAAAHGAKVVLMTALGVDADDAIPYRQVELKLIKSGTPYIILRPSWFADNFHTFWKGGVSAGRFGLPAGDGATSFIDLRDLVASIAAALTTDRFDGQAFVLTGPQALTYTQAAAILSEVVGKPVTYEAIDDAAFVTMLTGFGMTEDYSRFLASIFYPVRQGWAAASTDAVETLTGRKPIPLATYARDHAADLKA